MSKPEAEQRALELLKRVRMDHKALAYPDQLSGGQQQRIARALAMEPMVMLDEITSALDPELVSEVLNIVRELAQEGMTMLLATHEMGFAKEVSSKVCFLFNDVCTKRANPNRFSVTHKMNARSDF
jgi:polar amino acid transport system ATP-binding protein